MRWVDYGEDVMNEFPMKYRRRFEDFTLQCGDYTLCKRDWCINEQIYYFHRMYYVISGEAYYQSKGQTTQLQPGHLYIFPAETVLYSGWHNPDAPLEVLWCHFQIMPEIANNFIDVDADADDMLKNVIGCWRRVATLSMPGNETFQITQLVLYLIERKGVFEYRLNAIDAVRRYILDNLSADLSVASLAARFGYTRSYFSRKFQENYHMSPNRYVRSIRMNFAAILLMKGEPLNRVCAAIGYSDEKSFKRAFREYYRVPPQEYVKSRVLQP